MNQIELNTYLTATRNAAPDPFVGLVFTPRGYTLYPYYNPITKVTELTVAYWGIVLNVMTKSQWTVLLALGSIHEDGEWDFKLSCGDSFFENRLATTLLENRITEATAGFVDSAEKAQSLRAFTENPVAHSAVCDFNRQWKQHQKPCVHTSLFLQYIDERPDIVSDLKTQFESLSKQTGKVNSSSYTLEELAFRSPILIEGEHGSSKTTTVRNFASNHAEVFIRVGGHAGLQSFDFLGGVVPMSGLEKTYVWKDGPVAAAFRAANAGKKVVLFLDELLRIPLRELSILYTALSPYQGKYHISTDRIVSVSAEGIGITEELECPVANLCMVAATNIGSEYAVDEIDPALADRFSIIRMDVTESSLVAILNDVCTLKKFPDKDVVISKLLEFYLQMAEAHTQGLVKYKPSARRLSLSIELATRPEDIVRSLKTDALLWVGRDTAGFPIEEQLETVAQIIADIF